VDAHIALGCCDKFLLKWLGLMTDDHIQTAPAVKEIEMVNRILLDNFNRNSNSLLILLNYFLALGSATKASVR
jgi:hypothetical protein